MNSEIGSSNILLDLLTTYYKVYSPGYLPNLHSCNYNKLLILNNKIIN